MPVYRNRITAFFMNFLPGLGHYYWGKKARCVIYMLLFFGSLLGGFMLALVSNSGDIFIAGIVFAALVWGLSMFDLFIVLLKDYPGEGYESVYGPPPVSNRRLESDRFFTILLSFLPGLGHLHMGLMQRGLSFLVAFFGTITMLIFLAGITHDSVFLLFLGVLPVIWLYCMFDAVQCIHRKQAGDLVQDRTLFDEWEMGRESGRRSKVLATLLSMIPGAGHMYLGLLKRGVQLMVLFLGTFYIIDVMRLSLFLFLLPLIWFYSFFDGLQTISRYGREPLIDKPLVDRIGSHKHLLGLLLLALGIYYISMNLIVPYLDVHFPELRINYRIEKYLRPFIVSVVLIGGGIRLLAGGKKKPSAFQMERRNLDDDRF
ncbi:hypothetical protein [Paenibacillus sp. J22TS3]|uniref:hypothetical protein n=1 Tax=Paenibacillus sp. J22TS3 TaxID=2807192 RepID=UPI001B2EE1FE|nr:hypothetical protein [Paenibacillus sp. J22TS3]GIP20052.1 hypothetical protein J22TS3_03270 [Paenibacillus sp. J22TS3]